MKFTIITFSFLTITATTMTACSNSGSDDKKQIDKDLLDPNRSLNTNFEGKIFSIPSPVQTAMLIKSLNLPFNEQLLHAVAKSNSYTTEYKQALNLGIYGTDLGYTSLYEQKNVALKYLSAVEKLTGELGLEGAFDKSFMTRFEKNSENQDSMTMIVSDAFRKADNFLKKSDRKATSALILTGGWIESLHFATELNTISKNPKIKDRIGEQQQTLSTIIEILEEYNKKHAHDALISSLKDLKTDFDKVKIDYQFVEPKTDEKNKITTLQHKITIEIDEATLKSIHQKVTAIRQEIIK